jgi:2-succinyl-6-hydroxy-2,4-cyclohexadiene-1-carboxylate synthase
MSLATERRAPTGGGPVGDRLVLAHGFTQNARCWGPFADRLASHHELVLVDAPGHGRSGHDEADLWTSADLLTEAGGPAVYVGYSMGGRTALHGALAHPDRVRGLVLIGATAGLVSEEERADRRRADAELADHLVAVGLPAFLDRWLSQPLFAGLDEQAAAREARLANRPDGLAASLRACGTGSQEPLWDRLARLAMPVLLVVGDRDRKFSELARRMAGAMTGTDPEVLSLPGTHAVHLENPDACADAIEARIGGW